MLEMDAGPQKIAKGALMRRDIWERLQVHWLHAQEMLQYCCQLKIIPVLWTHVVHEDKSLGTTDPHVEASAKLRWKVNNPLVLCSTRQLLPFSCTPGQLAPSFDFAQQQAPHSLRDGTLSAWGSQEPKLRWDMPLLPSCICWARCHQRQESGTVSSHSHHHCHDTEDGE